MKVQGKKFAYSKNVTGPDRIPELEPYLDDTFAGVIPRELAGKLSLDMGITIDALMLRLTQYASLFARPSISKFRVGAVSRGCSGNLYFGANIEFLEQALSFSVHGEQAATANAILHGENGLVSLAISAAPCGYCRQFLYEISTSESLLVVFKGTKALLPELLPDPFGPKDLGVDTALMLPQDHSLKLIEPSDDLFVVAGLEQANKSYSPYSFCYSGVVLQDRDGNVYRGSYAENAAFNPSMSPAEACLVNFIFSGKPYSDISRAALVEAQASKASQAKATADVLSAISDIELEVYFAEESS